MLTELERGYGRSGKGWLRRVARLFERATVSEELWDELEELLISADVGMSTAAKLIQRVRARAAKEDLNQGQQLLSALKDEMVGILSVDAPSGEPSDKDRDTDHPRVIMVVGVNGTGKTLSIAKLASQFISRGEKVVLAAADTFRAAAIEQLKILGQRVGAEVICHKPGADPGAVVFDSMEAARARQADVVIIDTAGRLHTKFNLMEELKKVKRVVSRSDPGAPHEVILVIDATTGQNGLSQARYFAEAVDVTGVFLSKLDGTAKGGIVLAICDELNIPVQYVGIGEGIGNFALFDARKFVEELSS